MTTSRRTIDFDTVFATLTGVSPFPWQRELFKLFVAGEIPSTCVIPTGLGKTSVIAVWLIARSAGANLPRRLVYVVNRRTVVDQTTDEVERLRLHAAAAGIPAPAVSTLRGQFEDNREWSEDPSRSAVVSGTVDMIGSRLLFSGYRLGFKTRPLHAGFLGQDALIVHDESHLEPAFQSLLETIVDEQRRARDPWPMRLMALSATARREDPDSTFGITDEDRRHREVRDRIKATKRLSLHPCDEKGTVAAIVAKVISFESSARAILVFVQTVDAVHKVLASLPKGMKALPLTGTMRGYERDDLVQTPVFSRFLAPRSRQCEAADGTTVLVCTSAGEVGVNISADHLVTDLSTFEAMAQRFGRVNRFGERTDTEVHVFHPSEEALAAAVKAGKDPNASRLLATLALLSDLGGDASPAALAALPAAARQGAFSRPPDILPATEILFDAWSMTTIRSRLPGRPAVTDYLHGVAEWEPPVVQVAWRDEVDRIDDRLRGEYPPEDLLEDYPLKPHELLRDRTSRVVEALLAGLGGATAAIVPLWIIEPDGTIDATDLVSLTTGDRKLLERRLNDCTILLPPSKCRPAGGMFVEASWSLPVGRSAPGDVADEWFTPGGDSPGEERRQRRRRVLDATKRPEGMRLIRSIQLHPEVEDTEESTEDTPRPRVWSWYELPWGGDADGPRYAKKPVTLTVHSGDVRKHAERFVETLGLAPNIARAVVTAAWLHDIGKRRRVWQRSIGNPISDVVLAKGGRALEAPELTPYRHELGSVFDALREHRLDEIEETERDLVLHLVAAHHGRARPHFPSDGLMDPETRGLDFAAEGVRVMRRFAMLQRRFGRWGLAYLESLVRAADYAASDEPSEFWENGR